MTRNLIVKTVEFPSRSKRACRRQPGHVPYPIKYCNQMADFDIWHHMFLVSYLGNLTVHQFLQPPTMVLDLGCGTGYWAIEAAKRWQNSKIYGYDTAVIQPQIAKMGNKFRPLARRIEWVHGNFLDGLPFPSNHFDFVRIAGLGLAIPEDEWQTVLEDVRRVLKAGGVLEIIEEDLLFPCSSALLQKPPQPSSPPSPSGGQLPIFDLYTNKAISREMPNALYGRTRTLSRATSADSFHDPLYPIFRPGLTPSLALHKSRQPFSSLLTSSSSQNSASETEHPQDHTRLKTAWDAMLATRFLSPNLLSVIPFYLTSSSFVDTKAHAPLVVALPPNSGTIPTLNPHSTGFFQCNDSERNVYDLSPNCNSRSIKTDGFSFRSSVSSVVKPQTSMWGTMHLAKTVSTVRGCKEAIWKEYDELYSDDALHLLSRTAPEEDCSSQEPVHISRKAFEVDWKNWELDMTDRIGMRGSLSAQIPWVPSIPDTERDRPDWLTWRENLDQRSEGNSGYLIAGYNPSDSCRSLRIFTGLKSMEDPIL